MKNKTLYKWLVTVEKGTEKHKFHYSELFCITEDMHGDLHKYMQKGYTVKIEKIA